MGDQINQTNTRMRRGPKLLRRAERGIYRGVLSNVRRAMGSEGKFLGRGGGLDFDPYEPKDTNEVADRMAGYASPNDTLGKQRTEQSINRAALKELWERIQTNPEHRKLVASINARQVIIRRVGVDPDYDWAMQYDNVNAVKNKKLGLYSVVFKFVKRGVR